MSLNEAPTPEGLAAEFWDRFIRPDMRASGVPLGALDHLRSRYVQDATANYAAMMAIEVALRRSSGLTADMPTPHATEPPPMI